MKIETFNIKDLIMYENNPRKNDDAVEKVAESIQEFGFKVPMVIDKNNVIVCGHTRYKACIQLGINEVPCVIADDLNDEQIKAFRLVDNKVGELAEWDIEKLNEELENIMDIDMSVFDFDVDGFDGVSRETFDGGDDVHESLNEKYIIPPFSIFDARKGYWQDRKRLWKKLINDDGQSRGQANLFEGMDSIKGALYDGFESFNNNSVLDPVLSEVIVKFFMPTHYKKCFDVFAGDAVFGFVSSYLGAEFTGIELREEQAEFNNQRASEFGLNAKYICDDGRNVLNHIEENSQDLLFSCPPYYDLEVYSDKPNDASNQETFEDFYKILDEAFSRAIQCLKNNRFAVIVVGEIRDKNGAYYDFTSRVKDTFIRNGMVFYNDIVLVDTVGTACIRAHGCMKNRKVVKTHQNVLVFYKGNLKDIQKDFEPIEFEEVDFGSEDE